MPSARGRWPRSRSTVAGDPAPGGSGGLSRPCSTWACFEQADTSAFHFSDGAWADDHLYHTGEWPKIKSGRILCTKETWHGVESALAQGCRGLPGGSSLAQLLSKKRSARNRQDSPKLTPKQILLWADQHHERFETWPTYRSGKIIDAAGETWNAVDLALIQGLSGLPGGSSLAKLLAERRGKRG